MHARGIVGIAAVAAIVVAGCSPDADASGELRDIREVLADGAEDRGSADEVAEPNPDGEVEGSQDRRGERASAEAQDAEGPDPDIDITEVPAEITIEYVQAVIDELERILAEALVLMMEEGELTIEVTDRVGEIFTVEQYHLRLEELTAAAEAGFQGMRPPEEIEPRHREVVSVLDVSERCIYIEALAFEEGLFPDITEPAPLFSVLRLPERSRPVELNPTPWVYAALAVGVESDLRQERPCHD